MARPRKKHSAKWDRCLRQIKRRGGRARSAAAVCTVAVRPRRTNPRQLVLYAQGKGKGAPVLKYIGGIKFARTGQPVKFDNKMHAAAVGLQLQEVFPVLRKLKLWAE